MGLDHLLKRWNNRKAAISPSALRGAKPLRNPEVAEEDRNGALILLGRPSKTTFLQRLVEKSGGSPLKQFELEEIGAFVWRLIDGNRTFEKISRELQSHYKMNRTEADASLAAFLQMLGDRGLITILVKK